MMTARHQLELTRGDCFDLALTYKANDAVVDLSGYSAEMVIAWPSGFTGKRGAFDSVSWTNGSVMMAGSVDAPAGKISFHMNSAGVSAIPPISDASYQVRLTDPSGCVKTILAGPVRVYGNLFS